MRFGWPLLLALAGCSGQPAIAPGGIVSNNPCIDAVLAEIAAPGQISAVSVYSHDTQSASAPLAWAKALPAIGTGAEDVILAKPRLLLTGNLSAGGTNAVLKKTGVEFQAFGVPASVDESKTQIRKIAAAIGRKPAGEELVRGIDRAISPLPHPPTPNPSRKREGNLTTAIIWQSGGFVAGKGTLQDELLTRAGFRNASAIFGLRQWEQLPLETLIRNPPDVIFMPVKVGGDAGREAMMRAKMLRYVPKTKIIAFPDRLLFCGGPTIIEAMRVMREGYIHATLAPPASGTGI